MPASEDEGRLKMNAFARASLPATLLITSASASAGPIFQYDFVVDSCVFHYSVTGHAAGSPCTSDLVTLLENATMALTLDAVQQRSASYYYHLFDPTVGQTPVYTNTGIADLVVPTPGLTGNLTHVTSLVPPPTLALTTIDISVDLGPAIADLDVGSFSFLGYSDTLMMTGSSGLWTGHFSSDFLAGIAPDFTGQWALVRVLPEPDSLSLTFLALLAALVGVRVRRKAPLAEVAPQAA
jgi:hypothetical protein